VQISSDNNTEKAEKQETQVEADIERKKEST
jgi:hypothetical protein